MHEFNFLVIEAKYDEGKTKIQRDIDKINKHWFAPRLQYQFGSVINLRRDKTSEVKVIKNPSKELARDASD